MFSEPALEIKKTTSQAGGPGTTSYDSLTKVSLSLLVKGYTKMSLIGRCTRGVFLSGAIHRLLSAVSPTRIQFADL